jgi:acetoin utilization protein AcuC
MVPVIYRPEYQSYDFGPQHPFSPLRLEMLVELLRELDPSWHPEPPPQASRDDVRTVHAERYLRRVEAASRGERPADLVEYGLGTSDTPAFAGMDAAARWLVGGTLEAARRVASGRARRVLQLGGGLHHAQFDRASGFCVYNDLAVAIHHLLEAGMRVLYMDVDVHHGDGVQWIYYKDPRVLTLSLHESGRYLFPGTGGVFEVGQEGGTGYSWNVPLEPYTGDACYLEAFEQVFDKALAWFLPDVILVQAGADAHFLDPLADLMLTTHAYERIFARILEGAERFTEGRVIFTLGGGYSFDAAVRVWALLYFLVQGREHPGALPEAWRVRWQARLGHELSPVLHDPEGPPAVPRRPEIERYDRGNVLRLLDVVRKYLTPG